MEFARFLGLQFAGRVNLTDIVEAVCVTAARTRVELVCVDELSNLNLATRAGAEVSDQLKYFAEWLPPALRCAADSFGAGRPGARHRLPVRDRSRLRTRGQLHHDQRPGPRRSRPRALGDRRGAVQLAGSVTSLS